MSVNTAMAIAIFATSSITSLNEELAFRSLPEQEDPNIAASLLAAGVRSQGDFAAIIINLKQGDVTGDEMREALSGAFPDAKIGKRHGGHYLCHARTGSLKLARFKPPTSGERKRLAKGPEAAKVEDLTAEQLTKAAEWKAAEEAKAIEDAKPKAASKAKPAKRAATKK